MENLSGNYKLTIMKELSFEEKAKAYDEVVGKLKRFMIQGVDPLITRADVQDFFPELVESEDEKMKRDLIAYFKNNSVYIKWSGLDVKKVIEWLEKQGKIDKVSYEIAEKEKNDFVSGQFIECRKSFDVFKEDNSYWFEYVGNDTYIGRSDNILNQKFHITPRQLYRLFSQQHRPKESNVNEETNAPTGYGKYVDGCLNEASKHFFSEGEDKYSVADLFYAGVRCEKSWLEKQSDQCPDYCVKSNCSDCDKYKPCADSKRLMQGLEVKKTDKYDGYMDKECITLCDTLNRLPNLQTFESCCGHLKDIYSIWFFCDNIDTISRLGRCVDRNYSDGKWEIIVDSSDTNPKGVFWLRSKEPFKTYDEMNDSIESLIESISHWFKKEFDSYFKGEQEFLENSSSKKDKNIINAIINSLDKEKLKRVWGITLDEVKSWLIRE